MNEDQLNLSQAVISNKAREVAEILNNGVNPNFTTHLGSTPLIDSICSDVGITIQLLEHGACPSSTDSNSFSALYYSILAGKIDRIFALLKHGASLSVCDSCMNANALHVACRLSGPHCLPGVFDLLLDNLSCDIVDQFDSVGRTPLMEAVRSRNERAVNKLISLTANIDLVQPNGALETSLHMSALHPDLPIARLLIDAGADRSATNIYGARPIDLYLSENRGASPDDEIGRLLLPY